MTKCPECNTGQITTVFEKNYLYRVCSNVECEFQSEFEYAIDEKNRPSISKHKGFRKWAKQRKEMIEDG